MNAIYNSKSNIRNIRELVAQTILGALIEAKNDCGTLLSNVNQDIFGNAFTANILHSAVKNTTFCWIEGDDCYTTDPVLFIERLTARYFAS